MKKFTISVIVYALSLLVMEFAVIAYENREDQWKLRPICDGSTPRDMEAELPKNIIYETDKEYVKREEGFYQPTYVTYKRMKLTSIGTYYLTAYCPYECGGSWSTASGETCHRASYKNRISEPTTAAISRSIHSFGTEFYIPAFDRTFVAEDTGPGVQGKHLDLFYEDYSDVLSFPTGYYEVYTIEWEEVTILASEELQEVFETESPTEYFWRLEGRFT